MHTHTPTQASKQAPASRKRGVQCGAQPAADGIERPSRPVTAALPASRLRSAQNQAHGRTSLNEKTSHPRHHSEVVYLTVASTSVLGLGSRSASISLQRRSGLSSNIHPSAPVFSLPKWFPSRTLSPFHVQHLNPGPGQPNTPEDHVRSQHTTHHPPSPCTMRPPFSGVLGHRKGGIHCLRRLSPCQDAGNTRWPRLATEHAPMTVTEIIDLFKRARISFTYAHTRPDNPSSMVSSIQHKVS